MALTFVKLSLLTQYLRMFKEYSHVTSFRKIRRLTIFLIGITSLWGIAYTFLAWVPCIPISGLWNTTEKAVRYGYGSQETDVFVWTYISHASINMALDIAVIAMPLSTWSIWSDKDNDKKSRAALIGLFALGGT